MQMFEGFDNLPEWYKPDNMHPRPPKGILLELTQDNVKPLFDKCGHCYGFEWKAGETVGIDIFNRKLVTLPAQCIKVYETGFEPTLDTHGYFIGQKLYNMTDIRSWTLTTWLELDDDYVWTEDKSFTYPSDGPDWEYIYDDMVGKSNIVELQNFRREVIDSRQYDEQYQIYWDLDKEKSAKIYSGIYYLALYKISETEKILDKTYEIHVV